MQKLFVVALGGKAKNSNIEVHDIRWVLGRDIKETIPHLKAQWIGAKNKLHIDSYITVEYVDGYKIQPIRIHKTSKSSKSTTPENENKTYLWFIYMGGYDAEKFEEQHKFDLIAAKNVYEAKKLAKKRWSHGFELKHVDSAKIIHIIPLVLSKNNTEIWQIDLVKDPLSRSQIIKPDWYGYWRIDNA